MDNQHPKQSEPVEREVVINGVRIRIKSIFEGQMSLSDAMKNLVTRKLAEEGKPFYQE